MSDVKIGIGIKKHTWITKNYSMNGSAVNEVTFENFTPNFVQFKNFTTGTIYVSTQPGVS